MSCSARARLAVVWSTSRWTVYRGVERSRWVLLVKELGIRYTMMGSRVG